MIKSVFLHEFRQRSGVRIGSSYILFRNPLELLDMDTLNSVPFNNMEEAFGYKVDGETIEDYVNRSTLDIFKAIYDGGRGSDSGVTGTFKFNHASNNDKGENGKSDFPSRVNINIKNQDKTLEAFRKLHVNDKKESAFAVDSRGFVTQYIHGNSTSVAIFGRKGEMIYHNHPSGGAFSDSDLISTSLSPERGIVASGRKGDYIFEKGTHFQANNFVKAIKSARMRGETYDQAVDHWLTKNQKKFGYKYSFRKVND